MKQNVAIVLNNCYKQPVLLKGDCIELMKNITDGTIDTIITDPPYKMTKRGKSCRPNYMENGMGENLFSGELPNTKEWMKLCFNKLKQDAHFYVFTNTNSLSEFLNVADECGFKLHNIISMIKDTKMPNRWYLKYTELVLFFRKGKAFPINDMTSRDYEFIETPTLKNGKLHISQKPLKFIEKLIKNSSQENQTVLDLFMGSGTTGVACVNTKRNFIGIEKDENYFNIAKGRILKTIDTGLYNGSRICEGGTKDPYILDLLGLQNTFLEKDTKTGLTLDIEDDFDRDTDVPIKNK